MSEIKPALTEEEWAALDPNWFQKGRFGGDNYLTYDQRHAMAAKCLQYMPFGFTREDVEDEHLAYRDAVIVARHYQDAGDEQNQQLFIARAKRHISRAKRIEALLPPETPS